MTGQGRAGRRIGIVGGGLAGLAAAAAAVERGFHVELFEQAKWLGGRAGSFVDSTTGQRIDYCHHVAMGCCERFLEFCRLTGVDDCFERAAAIPFIDVENVQHDFVPSRWLPAPLHLLPGLMKLKFLSPSERWHIILAMRKLVSPRTSPRPLAGEGPGGEGGRELLFRQVPSSHFRRGQSHFRRTKIGTVPRSPGGRGDH